MKEKISIFFMRIIRRIIRPIQKWYHQYAFLAGLEAHGSGISVKGIVQLWNDNVQMGNKVNVYPGVTLWGPGKISIGNNAEVGLNTTIYSTENVRIGDNVLIASNCYIIDSNHGIAKNALIREQKSVVKGPVVIEDDVWLGAGAKVLSGVHIGQGAVIGANAVVNMDIPAYAVAAGVPARIIRYRE